MSLQAAYETQEALKKAGFQYGADGRIYKVDETGETTAIVSGMSRGELKTAYVLSSNVEAFFRRHPLGRIGFLTLTFPPSVVTPSEANRRFNQFNSHFLRDRALEWIKVTEPHKDKRPHFHLLVAFPCELRQGFDFETFAAAQDEYRANGKTGLHDQLTRSYVAGATSSLRSLWKEIREACKAHRIGRSELLPIKKEGEAATKYVGKYIEKGSVHRVGAWKGARLTSYSRGFPRVANSRFSWVVAQSFRLYAAECAEFHRVPESDMVERFGSKWAYKVLLSHANGLRPHECARFLVDSQRNQASNSVD